MKVILLYLRILKRFDPTYPEMKSYNESSVRFLRTYQTFRPKIPHRLVVVNCGATQHDAMFDCVADEYRTYNGGGFDCGTYQAVASTLNCDLVLALNTHTYFWSHDWLEPFVVAATNFGPGVFGASSSFERFPHLRTPAIAFNPKIICGYPVMVDTRDKAADFEAGNQNFSAWAMQMHYPVLLVTRNAFYSIEHWRTPANIFRRGNQSNCLIFDRHTDVYAAADFQEKRNLEKLADNRAS